MALKLSETKQSLLAELQARVEDKILEPSNAALLSKLISNADNDDEALAIAALGTTYKRTGFHFDKRMEEPRMSDTIKYFKKNEALSFGKAKEGEPVHKLIIGDNYDALQNLLIQYRNGIDVIYIDPPYGKDSMGEFAETNYENSISRDNLLSMLYFRLKLAKQLLSEKGVIFCSVDDKNQAYIKCLFDEIFGEKNFQGNIHWRRRHNQPNDKTKMIGLVAEHILVYSNDSNYLKKYGVGKIAITGKFSNPDNDPRGDWASKPWKAGSDQGGCYYSITSPCGDIFTEIWMGDEDTFHNLLEDKRIYFTNKGHGLPRKKYYKSERDKEGQCATNWWPSNLFGNNQGASDLLSSIMGEKNLFSNPKPIELIKPLIQISSKAKVGVVLDFFAGSGTTGHAVLDLNTDDYKYEFILCQLNEKNESNPNGIAYDVTSKRLKRIMTGECYDGSKDFKWAEENEPYGGRLDVYEIAEVSNACASAGKTPFDVIDETLYGKECFKTIREKVEWVCSNFSQTQMTVKHED
ncbi:MAG: site-specific DNA-methyltransferase [Bacteroidaceae bacterium]|nr:site-specific DNA-methyltransferase [Bacteroidaceae bacterium]